jgi:hypothetical protein
MSENTNTNLTVETWLDLVIENWVKKATALGIHPDDPLTAQRFMHHVITDANGDPAKIQFVYDYYLNFIDWGVGKGVTISNRNYITHNRLKKQWFTGVFYYQVKKLAEIMARKYALKSAYLFIDTGNG